MSLWGIIKSGDVAGAVKKVVALIEGEVTALETEFPIIGTFLTQFESDFGKAALKLAEAAAPDVISGKTPITEAAATLITGVTAQGIAIAEHDATQVALNALRLYVSAPAQATPAA